MNNKLPTTITSVFTTMEDVDNISTELVTSSNFIQQYNQLLQWVDELDQLKSSVNKKILTIMSEEYLKTGEQTKKVENYSFIYVPATTRESLDTKSLKLSEPELYKKYVKVSKVSPTVRVVKSKENKQEGEAHE